jgi:hypothetical protein
MATGSVMKPKTVYLNEQAVGSARSWHEVAALLTKWFGRTISARAALDVGSEGREGFYVSMRE